MSLRSMEVIEFEEAYKRVMAPAFSTGTETVSFIDSVCRVLAEDIKSDMDMPPFNKATVDGFACRRADLGSEMEILETIPAGSIPTKPVTTGRCSRIMTGAALPDGADMVFMVEESKLVGTDRVRFTGTFSKENISYQGEDIKSGDTVLRAGKLVKPQDIAVMASAGHTSVKVHKKPVVSVISTGDELVEPSEMPGISQIRNSNAYQLLAQVKRAGGEGRYSGIAGDNEETTYKLIKTAISESDIVLITGGVSMGDFDFVPSVLEKAGVTIMFSRVNIQPGKPTTFGVHSKALVFGLPGNPVSSFIQFELLVRPLISKMMGYEFDPLTISLPMKESFSRRAVDRLGMIPVVLTKEGLVSAAEYHGSGHISALSGAYGIIPMAPGKKSFEKGEIVSVRQI